MVVPIDAAIRVKTAAMEAHRSQFELTDYVSAFLALARYRSLRFPSCTYAEAFVTCQARDIVRAHRSPGIHVPMSEPAGMARVC